MHPLIMLSVTLIAIAAIFLCCYLAIKFKACISQSIKRDQVLREYFISLESMKSTPPGYAKMQHLKKCEQAMATLKGLTKYCPPTKITNNVTHIDAERVKNKLNQMAS